MKRKEVKTNTDLFQGRSFSQSSDETAEGAFSKRAVR
jgi:hypothetical protein